MGTRDEHTLRRRLARVEALHRGATTRGEREAAARARDRLIASLDHVRAEDPIARFCAEQVAELGVSPRPPPPPPTALPEEAELLRALACWEAGTWTTGQLHAWAAELVDRVHLPDDPDDPGAVVSEVLLQLAALHHVRLVPEDVTAVRRFVRTGDWNAWFVVIERASRRHRRAAG